MASRFASVSEEEILSMNEEAVPKNTKMATKFGVIVLILMEMIPHQLNKCLQKFYLSSRRRDGTFYNKNSLTAIRSALDRHLRSPPLNKPFFHYRRTSFYRSKQNPQQLIKNSQQKIEAT
ncbi:unnamed protein product [Porites evermanni]|uniref:Uncharacterized protein n=1 Tax=Porites evermanni TaxID=104178 RepID=A0ABN8LRF6_9CNID|nr:unnamed protein product [Porites evermanni]